MEEMNCRDTILDRKSCRAFLPGNVAKDIITDLLEVARRSPSYMNTQPWEIFVLTGAKKDSLVQRMLQEVKQGVPAAPDVPFPAEWPPSLASRSKAHRLNRFAFLGIDPESDKDKIRAQYMANLTFYDAPCVIIIGMDRSLTPWSMLDIGMFAQSFLLAAHARSLGACPQALPTGYPQVIRQELELDENISIVLAISMGYPDETVRINGYRSDRKEQETFVRWYGF